MYQREAAYQYIKARRRTTHDVVNRDWDDDSEEDEYRPLSKWEKMHEVGMYMSDFI